MDFVKRQIGNVYGVPIKVKVRVKLKPCPFCGGKAKLKRVTVYNPFPHIGDFTVECLKCCSLTGIKDTEIEAVKAWNGR